MKISDSLIQMTSYRAYSQETYSQESLRSWGNTRGRHSGEEAGKVPRSDEDRVSLSPQVLKRTMPVKHEKMAEISEADVKKMLDQEDKDLYSVKLILEQLTGKKINLRHAVKHEIADRPTPHRTRTPAKAQKTAPEGVGWGLAYDYQEASYEREEVSVNINGVIKTSDNQEVSFDMQLYMAREFYQSTSINVRAGDTEFIDPLVVNFDAPAASLTPKTIFFDLDMDGDAEQIGFTGSGSGFLTLDRNNDGVINDGSELFGPSTGHGFGELRIFDQDGNGWLDENDPMFDQLKIWAMDSGGKGYLMSLQEANIGAIFLDSADSLFTTRDTRAIYGQIKESGFFLREDFSMGSIQEVDLAV